MIEFACPNCGREMRVTDAAAGLNGTCKSCDKTVVVPGRRGELSINSAELIHASARNRSHPSVAVQVNIHQPSKASHSLGIAAIILGILAFMICWIPLIGLIGVPLSGLGLLLGIIGIVLAATRSGAGIGFPIAGAAICGMALSVAIGITYVFSKAVSDVARAKNEDRNERFVLPQENGTEPAQLPQVPENKIAEVKNSRKLTIRGGQGVFHTRQLTVGDNWTIRWHFQDSDRSTDGISVWPIRGDEALLSVDLGKSQPVKPHGRAGAVIIPDGGTYIIQISALRDWTLIVEGEDPTKPYAGIDVQPGDDKFMSSFLKSGGMGVAKKTPAKPVPVPVNGGVVPVPDIVPETAATEAKPDGAWEAIDWTDMKATQDIRNSDIDGSRYVLTIEGRDFGTIPHNGRWSVVSFDVMVKAKLPSLFCSVNGVGLEIGKYLDAGKLTRVIIMHLPAAQKLVCLLDGKSAVSASAPANMNDKLRLKIALKQPSIATIDLREASVFTGSKPPGELLKRMGISDAPATLLDKPVAAVAGPIPTEFREFFERADAATAELVEGIKKKIAGLEKAIGDIDTLPVDKRRMEQELLLVRAKLASLNRSKPFAFLRNNPAVGELGTLQTARVVAIHDIQSVVASVADIYGARLTEVNTKSLKMKVGVTIDEDAVWQVVAVDETPSAAIADSLKAKKLVVLKPVDKNELETYRAATATGGSSKPVGSTDSGLQEVISEGVGATPGEALKDAFRNAVRQVVGAVIEAETLIKNDEVIDDKVLTYSDGFIKTYDKVPNSESQTGGIHRVKIRAKVERRSVLAKLKAAKVETKDVDGKGLAAEAVTKLEAEQNASELLNDALAGFPASIIKATVIGQAKLVEKSAEKTTVAFNVDVSTDFERYETFQKRLSAILRKVALRQGRCQLETKAATKDQATKLDHHLRGGSITPFVAIPPDKSGIIPITKSTSFDPLRVLWLKDDKDAFGKVWWATPLEARTEMVVVLNTSRTKTHDRSNWEWFHIQRPKAFRSSVAVSVLLTDSDGRVLATDQFGLQQQPGLRLGEGDPLVAIISPYWIMRPLHASDEQSLSVTMHTTREVSIGQKDLNSVKQIQGTVANLEVKSRDIK